MASEDLMAYMAGQENSGGNNGGMFGGGIYDLLALALVFGAWGGGGFGFGGFGGGGGAGFQGMATRADINEAFALNGIENGIRSIQQGLCDSTYALTSRIDSCCCDTQRSIDGVKFDMAAGFCNLGNTFQNAIRDVIDNQNANYRGLMDFLVTEKLAAKDARIAELTNQVSQANQNAVIQAAISASTAEIIRRTGNDCPTPAYWVSPPTPVQVPYQNGCGCGCG